MIYFPVFIIHIHTFYLYYFFFFFHDTATTEIYTLSLHDALPISTLEAEALAPAFLAYAELIRLNPVDRLLVARASIRDGLLVQVAKGIQSGSAVFFPEQTIAAALNLARKYHADERHGLHTAALARSRSEEHTSELPS